MKISPDEVIDDNLVVVADKVNIDGTIKGDFTAYARSVQIDGLVQGDVAVTSGSFNLNGEVEGSILVLAVNSSINGTARRSVHLWGNSIESDGKIGNTLTVLGNIIRLDEDNSIEKDVLVVGRRVEVKGEISRDLSGVAWQADIGAHVGRDLELEVWRIQLMPQAIVDGAMRYVSNQRISTEEEKSILGEIRYLPLAEGRVWSWVNGYYNGLRSLASSPIFKIGSGISMLLVGMVFVFFSPVNVLAVSDQMRKNPFGSLFMGVAFFIITPIVVLFLFILVVGIPVGIILLYTYLMALYTSRIFVGMATGRAILRLFGLRVGISRRRQLLALFLGILLLNASTYIPYAGFWLATLFVIWGIGALALEISVG